MQPLTHSAVPTLIAGQVERSTQKLQKKATWFSKADLERLQNLNCLLAGSEAPGDMFELNAVGWPHSAIWSLVAASLNK